ncbi:MAG: hypothetical protein KDJ99_29375 [Candidatus Competibacteraceae bacterium]|nr:hypothetical protein [Candidatus Competibacteraceae bacterium]
MLILTTGDWQKVFNQHFAIRMARTRLDVTGHAYGMYETGDESRMTFQQRLQIMQAPPANWYNRLFNTMSLMMDFTVGNPETAFLLLIRDTVRCDAHHFPATGLRRGDGLSFPRVNLSLRGRNPAVVSNYFLDSPHPAIRTDANRLEPLCDKVIRMIKAAP